MKQVILQMPVTTVVTPETCSDNKYYGIQSKYGGSKGFICRSAYNNGAFIPMCLRGVTQGNSWDSFISVTLSATVKNILENGYLKVFEFDNEKEFAAWLAQ